MLTIRNSGQAVVATNYWSTPHAANGLLYISINAGAIRVLVPPATAYLLAELPPVGTPCRYEQGERTCRIVLLDDPADPYVIEVDARQVDRRLPAEDRGRTVPLLWYIPGDGPEAVRLARREEAIIA